MLSDSSPSSEGRSIAAVRPHATLATLGLTPRIVRGAIRYLYSVIDAIDEKLIEAGSERLAGLVELANLSAIVGNLVRRGVEIASDGKFAANAPHTYPDLVGVGDGCSDIEIKVALETNRPKGHLIKAGPYLTVRYVLGDASGGYRPGRSMRGDVVWIWEIRVGILKEVHFNFSNTSGDSGKTAVVNAAGMDALDIVYCDLDRVPISKSGRNYAKVAALFT